jgi:hypothetical protein
MESAMLSSLQERCHAIASDFSADPFGHCNFCELAPASMAIRATSGFFVC